MTSTWGAGHSAVPLPVVRGGLHRLVTERLGQAITSGELVEGQQIVPDELGAELDVSRTVIREALRVLAEKGLVTASPRTGTRVTNIDRWSLLDPDVIMWRVNGPQREVQLRELISLRFGVEPLAAHGAAESASKEDIADLRKATEKMRDAIETSDVVAFTRADMVFHGRILASSGNLIYRQFARPIEAVLLARQDLGMMPPQIDNSVFTHHCEIVDAIEAGDGERAEALTREMIAVARDEVFAEAARQDDAR
ncbi:MAG: FadR/GntR family transcriptional regulator [Cellulomonas sp.]